jgi:hypothetical protein
VSLLFPVSSYADHGRSRSPEMYIHPSNARRHFLTMLSPDVKQLSEDVERRLSRWRFIVTRYLTYWIVIYYAGFLATLI